MLYIPWLRNKKIIHMAAGDILTVVVAQEAQDRFCFYFFCSASKRLRSPVTFSLSACVIEHLALGGEHVIWVVKNLQGNSLTYVSGGNRFGQLGLGHAQLVKGFSRAPFWDGANISHVAAGNNHTLIAVQGHEKKVYAFGGNAYGQLGLGNNRNCYTPTEILPLRGKNVVCLAAGALHSIVVTQENLLTWEIYTFGDNCFGQLGRVLTAREPQNQPCKMDDENLPDGLKFIRVVAGAEHTLILVEVDENGCHQLYACGNNTDGRLGIPNRSNITQLQHVDEAFYGDQFFLDLATGAKHTVAVVLDENDNEVVYTFGSKAEGRLGIALGMGPISPMTHEPQRVHLGEFESF